MKDILMTINHLLDHGESIVLASIVKQLGSSPRGTEAKMIIKKKGDIIGTVGGGSLETVVQKTAQGLFESKESIIKEFELSEADVAKLGMICGGKVTAYLQYIDANDDRNKEIYEKLTQNYGSFSQGWLVTSIFSEGKTFELSFYIKDDDSDSMVENSLLEKLKSHFTGHKEYLELETEKYLIEPLPKVSKAFVFGGGHVGLEIIWQLSRIGFYTTIIDDRYEFANEKRFPTADAVVCSKLTDDLFDRLGIDSNSYIVIVTRGHAYDGAVLEKALETDAAYIGMIGSETKKDILYKKMRDKGFTQTDIDRVYSPIGLAIKAETPAEIAVSIAAEMIKVRAEYND